MGESKAGEEAAAYEAAEGYVASCLSVCFSHILLNAHVTFLSVTEKSATRAMAQLRGRYWEEEAR
jgi:hypothetical protein